LKPVFLRPYRVFGRDSGDVETVCAAMTDAVRDHLGDELRLLATFVEARSR